MKLQLKTNVSGVPSPLDDEDSVLRLTPSQETLVCVWGSLW